MNSALSRASPPAPPGHLVWGHGPAFNRDQLGYLTFLARNYGDLIPLRFTPLRAVFVNHPDLISEVLVSRSRSFKKSLAMRRAGALLGNGLVLSEGEFWLRQRRLVQPAFHRERIAACGSVTVEWTERLLANWREGEQRDVQPEMMRLTLQIACKTLYGVDVAGAATEVGAAFTTALECLQARVSGLQILLPDSVPTPTSLRLRRAVKRVDALVYAILAERRARGSDPGDLLSLLLQVRDADDGIGMTDRQLRDEVTTLVFAGHETTALALTWTWYLLAQHPAAEARLHAELSAVLRGRVPVAADVPDLPYTNAVIAEALRLYPPVWAFGREAIENTSIGEYPIAKGTIVLLSPWTVHRDRRYFADPDGFQPERWLNGLVARLPRFAYFPFGGGPRQCIGNSFALLEAALVVATVAQRHRLVLAANQTIQPVPTGTLRPQQGVQMQLQARTAEARVW